MKKLLLAILLPLYLQGQNTIGLPDVMNYTRQQYSAGIQNWDIKQDKNGIIYIANNEGLLSYDGKNWLLHPLPNKTIVRSVEIAFDNRVYAGGQNELGYFSPGSNGTLQYHSLIELIPQKDRSFDDVWDIVSWNRNVFFRSTSKIFRFTDNRVTVYNAPKEWSYLGSANGSLYAHDYKSGLLMFDGNIWSPSGSANSIPPDDAVTSILPVNKDSSIITSLKHGLLFLDKNGISKFPSSSNALFENERIYAAANISSNWLALATTGNGVYIFNWKENSIVQQFSRKEGLQNNNVLSIYPDNQGNLWLGLDNGIDLIAYNSAIKQILPSDHAGSGYTAAIYNNNLYLGTTNGVYYTPLQVTDDISFSKGVFEEVNNTRGQTWSLAVINNQLLLGKHEGAFVVRNNTAIPVSNEAGFWNFIPLSSIYPAPVIISGNYKNLSFFNYQNESFTAAGQVQDFNESSRFIVIDNDENIWVSHPYHGVYKIKKNAGNTFSIKTYTEKNGLPSLLNNHVYRVKNEMLVATEKGVYSYNVQKDMFEPAVFYKTLLNDLSVRYLKDDNAGNVWFVHEKTLGVIDVSGKKPVVYYIPELNKKILSGFEFIYPVDGKNILLGGEKGFYHINYEKYKQATSLIQVQIRNVRIGSQADSLLFGGYYKEANEKQEQDDDKFPRINYSNRTIRFEFASTQFTHSSNHEYSYRLNGFDDNWSNWNNRTEKEYTNLPTGKYVFEVKVRNNLGNESEPASFRFTILPPWYQTIGAKIFYLLVFCFLLYMLYRWQAKKFLLQQTKHEEEQKKLQYIHELERNKTESELVTLRNEKLEAEINFKNTELASSAMHLVKKGELLTKVKTELNQMMKRLDNEKAIGELKKMIKTLGEDENIDKEWENFTRHFDKVHSDFVVKLKEKHTDITANELKLCAYLRMNLSTKEIAQLMNISVRGVEISRYRLRKKLGISSEVSLFDYLINLHG